jgi:carboxymethylenebutenolidase
VSAEAGLARPVARVVVDAVPVISAVPAGPRRGGIVVLPEIWGLSPFVHQQVANLAALGFAAAAPSLYTVDGPDVASDKDNAFARLADLDDAEVLRRVGVATEVLGPGGPILVVGFCLGGRCALQAVLDEPQRFAGAAAFGPTGLLVPMTGRLLPLVDRLGELDRPVLLVVGDDDPYLPLADVDRVRAALGPVGDVAEVLVCAGAGHGFHNHLRPGFRAGPAAQAQARFETWVNTLVSAFESEGR